MDNPPHKKVTEVIFHGVKSFSGVEATLECVLVNHISFGVIEIIARDKLHQIETPRLYADDSIVRELMVRNDVSSVGEYLLNIICVAKYFPDSKLIELRLTSSTNGPPLTCCRPLGLKPYVFGDNTAS